MVRMPRMMKGRLGAWHASGRICPETLQRNLSWNHHRNCAGTLLEEPLPPSKHLGRSLQKSLQRHLGNSVRNPFRVTRWETFEDGAPLWGTRRADMKENSCGVRARIWEIRASLDARGLSWNLWKFMQPIVFAGLSMLVGFRSQAAQRTVRSLRVDFSRVVDLADWILAVFSGGWIVSGTLELSGWILEFGDMRVVSDCFRNCWFEWMDSGSLSEAPTRAFSGTFRNTWDVWPFSIWTLSPPFTRLLKMPDPLRNLPGHLKQTLPETIAGTLQVQFDEFGNNPFRGSLSRNL